MVGFSEEKMAVSDFGTSRATTYVQKTEKFYISSECPERWFGWFSAEGTEIVVSIALAYFADFAHVYTRRIQIVGTGKQVFNLV